MDPADCHAYLRFIPFVVSVAATVGGHRHRSHIVVMLNVAGVSLVSVSTPHILRKTGVPFSMPPPLPAPGGQHWYCVDGREGCVVLALAHPPRMFEGRFANVTTFGLLTWDSSIAGALGSAFERALFHRMRARICIKKGAYA